MGERAKDAHYAFLSISGHLNANGCGLWCQPNVPSPLSKISLPRLTLERHQAPEKRYSQNMRLHAFICRRISAKACELICMHCRLGLNVEWKCKFLLFCNFSVSYGIEEGVLGGESKQFYEAHRKACAHVLAPHYQFIPIKCMLIVFRGPLTTRFSASLSYQNK